MRKRSANEHPLTQLRRTMGVGEKPLSQAKFAKLFGQVRHTIDNIEGGKSRLRPELARQIAEYTGVNAESLVTGPPVERFGKPFSAESYHTWRCLKDHPAPSPPDRNEKQIHLAALVFVLLEAAEMKGCFSKCHQGLLDIMQELRSNLDLSLEIDAVLDLLNRDTAKERSKEELKGVPALKELLDAVREVVGGALFDAKEKLKVGPTLEWPLDPLRDDLPEIPDADSIIVQEIKTNPDGRKTGQSKERKVKRKGK